MISHIAFSFSHLITRSLCFPRLTCLSFSLPQRSCLCLSVHCTIPKVQIEGIGQVVDSTISPDGKWFVTVSGYFGTSTNYGGYGCITANNECPEAIGYIAIFKRDPYDGSLLIHAYER